MAREQLRAAERVHRHAPGQVMDPGHEAVRERGGLHWTTSLATPLVYRLGLLLLCGAYLQGGYNKLRDFDGAIAEMQHFGLAPAMPMAVAVIVIEIGASLMVLSGWHRWFGALALAGFTLLATLVANRFWELEAAARFMAENAFFEHLGLVGGLLLVAWHDLRVRHDR